MARRDPHSWYDDRQPRTKELIWHARVDFEARTLDCDATLVLEKPGSGLLDLDSRELQIREIRDGRGEPLKFVVEPPDKVLGSRVRVTLRRSRSSRPVVTRGRAPRDRRPRAPRTPSPRCGRSPARR